ncbi:MAG: DNA polymerase IV [Myxococcota bacterium]|nr:DNA polymerase IV [Myxococcota bacterium]
MILFAEVPNFYAEIECLRDPLLQGFPVVVGGDPRKRGLVQSASRDACATGVEPGMTMQEALVRCPEARTVKTDIKHYREVSGKLRGCLRAAAEAVEPISLEAAFVDAAPTQEAPESVAERLIARVQDSLDLALRVGIASTRFLARLAAEEAAPGRSFRIEAGHEAEFLAPLPLGRLPGVGPRTLETMRALGALSIGDLLRVDPSLLERELGNHGLRILELASGRGDSTVRGHRHPQSVSREQTFGNPELDQSEMENCLQHLCGLLGESLHEQGLAGRRVTLKVRFDDQQTTTRSRTLPTPVATSADIYPVTVMLLARTQAGARGVRLLGVSVAGLGSRPDDRQLGLFS